MTTRSNGNPAVATPEANLLHNLEARLDANQQRGQWQNDGRPQSVRKGANEQRIAEPLPSGVPHLWKWQETLPLLRAACAAMPKSSTSRRALICKNPGLQRGTTHTLLAAFQIVPPGEIAWAHRHTMNAMRFAIQGSEKVFTVVDGRPLAMEPYDLVLTPGWSWHDHHNESDADAIWMDGLDVPFALAINQGFQEDFGDATQPRTAEDAEFSPLVRPAAREAMNDARVTPSGARPYRYAWKDTLKVIQARSGDAVDPCHGRVFDYVNPLTGGAVLPTIACQIHYLPPGFEGRPHRRTSSSIAFVIEGEGRTVFHDCEVVWRGYDSLALPNWSWQRLINSSRREP